MKLIWKIFNFLFIILILILTTKIQSSKVEELSTFRSKVKINFTYTNAIKAKEMSPTEKNTFDKLRKPDAPSEIPENINFIQKLMSKSYNRAFNELNPRFKESMEMNNKFYSLYPVDKKKVGVPIRRDG